MDEELKLLLLQPAEEPRKNSVNIAPNLTGNSAIKTISHTHERIMDWLMLNPERSLRECADTFGYSQPWLSSLIHSDAFKAMFRKLHDGVHSRVMDDVPRKMQRIADIALDKLGDMVAKSESPDFILETSDKILHRMGYAPKATRLGEVSSNTQINNTFMVNSNDLAEARKFIGNIPQPAIIDVEPENKS